VCVCVVVVLQDFFRRMVRKARENSSDEKMTPDALRRSDVAKKFPRLVNCLDGGMNPLMVRIKAPHRSAEG